MDRQNEYSHRDWLEKLVKSSQKLQLDKYNIPCYKYQSYHQSDFKDQSILKTVVVIGETGVGKSTMINFFSNYQLGVQYEDPFRFIIIEESKKSQATSQTSEVTEYCVKGYDQNSALRIIDTPGFGDTRGFDVDEKISNLIISKLQELDSITLICFVMKSDSNRLTIHQKYIINRILQLFGNDVIQNFLFLFTFSDGSGAQALEAISFKGDNEHSASPLANLINKLNGTYWLEFNNVAFTSYGKKHMKLYWEDAYESFKIFQEKIRRTEFVTLKLTKEVIKERKQVQNIIINIRPEIQRQLHLINEIENNKKLIANLTQEQLESQNFKYQHEDYQIIQINLAPNEYTTNCIICNRTCHFPCAIPDSDEKFNCVAMTNGKCTICKSKCNWNDHKNMTFRFEIKRVMVEQTYENLKKRYYTSTLEKNSKHGMLIMMDSDLQNVKTKCQALITLLMKSINRLNEIALLPAISDIQSDYVQYLIKEEQETRKAGYEKRIDSLKIIQKDFEWLKQQIKKEKNQ